ncbi:hypothetical protein WICPIJ_008846 [Wickerhamomyces pijperi]|uniref:Uncharacterized protein n=1 Tax=Wickerhamomyces pijperi TaxID=599730 RepID=A0A9P8PU51_WICPI|nr:hypothetical protein WICPIJ_008846 [Wickerhamomyces pijperi]
MTDPETSTTNQRVRVHQVVLDRAAKTTNQVGHPVRNQLSVDIDVVLLLRGNSQRRDIDGNMQDPKESQRQNRGNLFDHQPPINNVQTVQLVEFTWHHDDDEMEQHKDADVERRQHQRVGQSQLDQQQSHSDSHSEGNLTESVEF